ncbi:MAG TPA: hypothetical protein VET23_04520 [Chitinophagaceae bacterium]|nr:hypothetical protein [Chitinophagaceae bacterium]
MKKVIILLIVMAVSLGATAQRHFVGHEGYRGQHIVVAAGRPFYYPSYYGFYDPFYYPFYPSYRYPVESRLELKIADIRNDYQDKIWSARHDKSLSKAKRKEIIHQLKHERNEAVNKAKTNYYKSR